MRTLVPTRPRHTARFCHIVKHRTIHPPRLTQPVFIPLPAPATGHHIALRIDALESPPGALLAHVLVASRLALRAEKLLGPLKHGRPPLLRAARGYRLACDVIGRLLRARAWLALRSSGRRYRVARAGCTVALPVGGRTGGARLVYRVSADVAIGIVIAILVRVDLPDSVPALDGFASLMVGSVFVCAAALAARSHARNGQPYAFGACGVRGVRRKAGIARDERVELDDVARGDVVAGYMVACRLANGASGT